MSNTNIEGLPVEMQQRIAEIFAQAKASPPLSLGTTPPAAMVGQQQQQAPLAPRPPSLMDHVIALRQEVAQLGQMVQAQGQVTEAVGQATGQLYQMFCQQTEPTTYSSSFQEAPPSQVDDF